MKNLYRVLLVSLCISMVMSIIPASASAAAGDAAKLDKVEVKAVPPQQAAGALVEVRAQFYIYGGCCYHLYTYDVQAEWQFPPEVEVISGPSPEKYGEIDGMPGGVPVVNSFTWVVKCSKEGDYDLKVNITTGNSGSVEGVGKLKITKGPAISMPTLSPSEPETKQDIYTEFEVYSPAEGVNVTEVQMFYFTSATYYENLTVNGSKYTIPGEDGILRTYDAIELSVRNNATEPTTYRAMFPKVKNEGYIYYWVYAEDTAGFKVTSQANIEKVTDMEKARSILSYVSISFFILTVAGIVLIVLLFLKLEKGKVRDKTKLFRLGSVGGMEFMDAKDRPMDEHPYRIYIIIGIFIVICMVLIAFSIITGSFTELVDHLDTGK